jgi:5-methylcytosine-specific restriction endonuclease McrA
MAKKLVIPAWAYTAPYQSYCCSKCSKFKLSIEFPWAKLLRHSWCRSCNAEAKKISREEFRKETPRKHRLLSECLTVDGLLVCSHCKQPHSLDKYQNNKPGWCRSCRTQKERDRRLAAGQKPKLKAEVTLGGKQCLACGIMRKFTEFYPASRGACNVGAYCKTCLTSKYRDSERARLATQKYRERNREEYLARHRLTQLKRKSGITALSDGSVTRQLVKKLYSTISCSYCLQPTPPKERTLDHITPLTVGGKHSKHNLVMACKRCNSTKRATPVNEFLIKQAYKVPNRPVKLFSTLLESNANA